MSGTVSKGSRVALSVLAITCYELFLLVLPHRPAAIVDNVMQIVVTSCAAVGCAWFAARSHGWERSWRLLSVIGLTAIVVGQTIWSWRQFVAPGQAIKPSWADVPYVIVVPVAIAALVIITRHVSVPVVRNETGFGRALEEARLCLDGLLVVGSLLLVVWMTTLDAMVAQNSTSRLAVALAVWYPSADILLIAMVLLVYLTRFIPRRNLRQLSLIGAGFAATAMSDVVFSYYLAGSPEYLGGGVGTYPLVADLGYFVGPILLAWAAALKDFTPAHSAARHSPRRTVARTPTWPHLPLLLATMFLSGKAITGTNLTPTEAVGAVAIFLLITLRQGVVLAATRFNQATDAEESRTSFKTTIRQVIDRAAKEATSADVGLTDGGTSADRPTGLRPASDKYLDHRLKDDLERLLRPHIQFLSDEHRRNIESLQRSGNRMALWTFAGGVVLGLLGNVVVALLIS